MLNHPQCDNNTLYAYTTEAVNSGSSPFLAMVNLAIPLFVVQQHHIKSDLWVFGNNMAGSVSSPSSSAPAIKFLTA
ncbi:hypothetical protein N7471_007389 [Penicillium samsonianum]|uniref:uncharacterized protein n=1 Tax=Penicillium samsonianum TaxID=1882272 RepID=UPI0025480377|nr:uncharacterized protein N7471_007389 [Penicillium samsonianum]KAJ6132174.1 hypothetical protein N7471_007389 [Penicillium samsonianum]